ncbi:MAG: cell division protein FtsQ, partial [Clostridiales bacterium]|nr:cell division protein FtsQ [Clostridiales bacterium]
FGYGADLTVVVPMTGDFEKRIFSLQRVMETFQERGETVTGTLDLTYGDEQARLLTSRWTPETGQTVQKGEDQNGSSDGSADAAEPDASPSPAQ